VILRGLVRSTDLHPQVLAQFQAAIGRIGRLHVALSRQVGAGAADHLVRSVYLGVLDQESRGGTLQYAHH
jgi:hypothetical protein